MSSGQEKGKQMRFTDHELALIKNVFKGQAGEQLLKLLRKVFLPEYDPSAPLGQAFDLWMTMDVQNMPPELAARHILARNQVITHIDHQLIQLSLLAGMEPVTPEEAKKAEAKNSLK